MNQSQQILQLAQMNNGTITNSMVDEKGFHRGSLKYLVDKGILERKERGVYGFPEIFPDDFFNMQTKYKSGSCERSLMLL